MNLEAEEQIAFARDQLERGITAVGALHPEVIQARLHLGLVLRQTGHLELSLEEFAQAAQDAAVALGPVHPDVLIARYHLLTALIEAGRPHEAEPQLWDLLAEHLDVFGPQHVGTFSVRFALADVLMAAGRFEEADGQLSMLLDEADRSGIELEPGQRATWLLRRSNCHRDPSQIPEAMELAQEAKEAANDPQAGSTALRVAAQARIVDAIARAITPYRDELSEGALRAWLDAAERELEQLREDLRSAEGDLQLAEGGTAWVNARLAEFAGAGLVEDAAAVLEEIRSFVDALMMLRGPDAITLTAASHLGELLGGSGRVEDAVAFLEGVVSGLEDAGLERTANALVLRNNLGQWLAEAGRLGDSVRVLRSAVDDVMGSSELWGVDRETLLRNLVDRASMHGDLATTRYATDLLEAIARGEAVVDAAVATHGPEAAGSHSVHLGPTKKAIDLVAAGTAPQSAEAVAEAVIACSRLGHSVLVERHDDGWCWSLAAQSIDDLAATLRSLDDDADDLPAFVLASSWIVRDGLTSWRPRPDAARAIRWWVIPAVELSSAEAVLDRIGGAA
jgi:tetratricopeptide (TPR) repeat protein